MQPTTLRTTSILLASLVCLCACVCSGAGASDEQMICDFESPEGMKVIESRGGVELVAEHATQGKKAGKVAPGFSLSCGEWTGLPKDWSGFDQLRLDVFNPGETTNLSLWITDGAGNDYWKRHNNRVPLRAGQNTITIPVGGLFRGEKGSGQFLDNKKIVQLLLSFPSDGKQSFFIDNFRLSKDAESATSGEQPKTEVLLDFEANAEPAAKWSMEDWPEDKPGKSTASISEEHATHGKKALKMEIRANGGGIHFGSFADPDWSKFDTLEIDCFNTSAKSITLSGWFADADAQKTDNDYWKRHNYRTNLAAGASTLRFPIGGLYRGEKGSGQFLDPHKMVGFCISTNDVTLFIDHVRLVKGANDTVVEGIKKFNFGPAKSATFPGFTAVHKDTSYSEKLGYGWLGGNPRDERDYEHPDTLTGHFVRCAGGETFAVDLPNGDYVIYLIMDAPQYWEYSYFSTRSVEAQGERVIHETVTPEQFLQKYFFLHQDDEDLPGTDIWSRYIDAHFQPKTVKASVTNGQLKLRFLGDTWGLTLSTLVIFPQKSSDAGQAWLSQLEKRRRAEFSNSYVEVVRKADPKPELSADELSNGYVLFTRDLEKEISYNSAPGAEKSDSRDVKLNWLCSPGEYASGNFAIYPLKDCGAVTVAASELSGPAGKIPASALHTRVIRYKMKRIGSRITSSYDYRPWLLTDFTAQPVAANVTRRFWVTCKVPDGTPAGTYTGQLTVTIAGGPRTIPITLEVHAIKLDEPSMSIGMYGGGRPTGGGGSLNAAFKLDERIEEVLRDQKEHGMTAVTPIAPGFRGIKNGKAEFDFSAADQQMELLRKLGYHHPCFTYAQMFNVREGDIEAQARTEYGVPLEEAIRLAYQELGAHAKEKNWLPMAWALADEPLIHGISAANVVKVFEAHRRAAPQMKFVSEDAMGDPGHWSVIPAIDIISANSPRYQVAEAVKKAGAKYWFNNIGTNRLTFGWLLWKAHAKMGVEALFQWGYSTNTGDIYYDLDGSEGDSGCSFTASEGQRARREWEMIREGMNDHRYLQTLSNLIAKAEAGDSAEAKAKAAEAKAFIDATMEPVDLEKKISPYSNADLDGFKRKLAQFIGELSK